MAQKKHQIHPNSGLILLGGMKVDTNVAGNLEGFTLDR